MPDKKIVQLTRIHIELKFNRINWGKERFLLSIFWSSKFNRRRILLRHYKL